MRLRLFGLLCALAVSTVAAKAQGGGLYLNPIVSRITLSTPDYGPFAFLGDGQTSRVFGGVTFGGYYDFLGKGDLRGGIDFRNSIEHGNSATLDSLLLGFRAVYNKPDSRWHTYILPELGMGRSKSPVNLVHKTKFEVDITAGEDYHVARHLDVRVLEIGYGSTTTVSSSQFNAPTNIPAARLLNVSTGLVFRFP